MLHLKNDVVAYVENKVVKNNTVNIMETMNT